MDGDGDGEDRLGVGAALAGAQRAPRCRSRHPAPDLRPWEPAGTGRGCAGSPRLHLRGSGGAPGSQSGAASGGRSGAAETEPPRGRYRVFTLRLENDAGSFLGDGTCRGDLRFCRGSLRAL